VVLIRGHPKRTKGGKSREPMAFWVHAVSDGKGGGAVACTVGGAAVGVVAAVGDRGGLSSDEERVWVGSEAVLGVGQWGAERGVERVGGWGVGVERVSGVGVDGWGALGRESSSCAVEFSGCVVECAVQVVGGGNRWRVLWG